MTKTPVVLDLLYRIPQVAWIEPGRYPWDSASPNCSLVNARPPDAPGTIDRVNHIDPDILLRQMAAGQFVQPVCYLLKIALLHLPTSERNSRHLPFDKGHLALFAPRIGMPLGNDVHRPYHIGCHHFVPT